MSKWLITISLLLTVALGLTIWDAYRQEFSGYQKAYFRMVELNTGEKAQREWAQNQRLGIKQEHLGELRRLDRCQTCHLAVDNPEFTGVPEPLRTHPSLLDSHPPERFGCAICHRGEELGTTTLAAHGQTEGQNKRLLKGEYMQANCYSCHSEKTLPPQAIEAVERGKQLLNINMCLRCHQINGDGGNEGPDLSLVGSRRDWLWIDAHFINPQAMNIVSTMPRFQFSRDEIKYLTIFLLTLENNSEKVTDNRFIAHKSADPAWRWPEVQTEAKTGTMKGVNLIPSMEYDGKELFAGAGCKTCHTISQNGGEVGPVLSYIARKYDRETFVRLLRNPADIFPRGLMPQLNLNEKQVQALADYLSTLK